MYREVLYREWIPIEYYNSIGLPPSVKKGTNCYSDFEKKALFHQWVIDSQGSKTVLNAVLETENGEIVIICSAAVKFIDTSKYLKDK